MKKGEIYEGVIEKVDFPNKGYVNIDGEKVIVKNGIPGQKVRFMINKKRSGRVEGRLLEVLEKSPLEVREPVCSIFPACGGCMYQTMSYEEQLKMKENQVKSLLQAASWGGRGSSLGGNPWEVPLSLDTGIRWNSLLGMSLRTVPCLWDFTRKEAPMMC